MILICAGRPSWAAIWRQRPSPSAGWLFGGSRCHRSRSAAGECGCCIKRCHHEWGPPRADVLVDESRMKQQAYPSTAMDLYSVQWLVLPLVDFANFSRCIGRLCDVWKDECLAGARARTRTHAHSVIRSRLPSFLPLLIHSLSTLSYSLSLSLIRTHTQAFGPIRRRFVAGERRLAAHDGSSPDRSAEAPPPAETGTGPFTKTRK